MSRRAACSWLLWPVLAQLFVALAIAAEADDPATWLQRMAASVQTANYAGTVIRVHGDATEALKVVHRFEDGVIREKVVAQEGNGLEIIRNGNEVHCILPDRKSVLVEQWDDRSTLFSTLPSSDVSFGSEYDLAIVREERVAGRAALLLAIRAHDDYRYGHRIWLDRQTAFPLQAELIAPDGEAIEQIKFADIEFDGDIGADALTSSYSTDNFRWFNQTSQHVGHEVESPWRCGDLPAGFRAMATHGETLPGSDVEVTHILYSDGVANVSVFIAPGDGTIDQGPAQVGGSNSYTVIIDGFRVTAVGEVPALTVSQIAKSMVPR